MQSRTYNHSLKQQHFFGESWIYSPHPSASRSSAGGSAHATLNIPVHLIDQMGLWLSKGFSPIGPVENKDACIKKLYRHDNVLQMDREEADGSSTTPMLLSSVIPDSFYLYSLVTKIGMVT